MSLKNFVILEETIISSYTGISSTAPWRSLYDQISKLTEMDHNSLLSHFQLPSSQSSRHPSSIILLKAVTYFRKSTLFSLSVAWNKLPEDIRSLSTTAKFSIAVRRYHSQSMFSLKGIPEFCV